MKKYLFFFLLFLFIAKNTSTQTIHWANEVVSFSSEANDEYRYYSAEQALGVPNAIGEKDLSPWAWQPKRPNAGKEYIRVRFKAGTKGVQQVYVSESAAPGGITRITLHDNRGKKHIIYENRNPRKLGVFERYRMFFVTMPPTSYYVKECTVEINTRAVPGANIDAIGITTEKDIVNIRKQINNLSYSTPVGEPENLGRQINSSYMERLPIVSPDGNTLYFTRKYHPENIGEKNNDDIWVSKRLPSGEWSYAENIGAPLNNSNHNYVVAINPTGSNIYLGNKYRSNDGGLSISSPKRSSWTKPIDLKIQNFYNDNIFAEYHVSVDERVMILAIERDDGFGERDLYVSFNKGEGRWSTPMNMGSTINTVNIENSVFLAADNKTLYFCSNGHYGYGGLDVFMTKRKDQTWTNWTTPKNLGPKINSNGNDYNFTIPASAEYAYFSSEENSYGQSDLFRIKLPKEARPEPVLLMTGKIVDISTNKPIQEATIKYNPIDQPHKDKNETDVQDDGSFQVVVPYGEDMEVYADIEGFFAVSQRMELSGDDLEGLDSDDPNDPLLNPKKRSNSPSREERELEEELARLNQELVDLKRKREERKSKYSRTKASYLNKPSVKTEDKPRARPRPGRDSELDYLKKKYYDQINARNTNPEHQKADKNGKEVSDIYDKLYANKEDDNTDNSAEQKPREESEEVNDIYGKLYGKKKEDKPKKASDPFAPAEEEEAVTATEDEESPEDEVAEIDAPSFEEVEKAMREQLREELIEQVKAELRKELMEEIEAELKAKTKDNEILEDAVAEVERENLIELDLIPTSQSKLEIDQDFEMELREIIVADITEELKEELEAPVKEELKEELSMKVKEKEKDAAQKKMDDWKKRRQREDDPVASEPSLKDKPEYVELNQNIEVVPIKVGQVIPMNNIFFDANKSTIKGQSSAELERVLAFLKKNDKLIVEVGGHTNGWCSTAFASELSRGRAKAVMDYFIENGVPENRIQYKGYGKLEPIASNESLAGRKKNQRVELKILEIVD